MSGLYIVTKGLELTVKSLLVIKDVADVLGINFWILINSCPIVLLLAKAIILWSLGRPTDKALVKLNFS